MVNVSAGGDEVLLELPDLNVASTIPSHLRIEHWLMRCISDGEITAGHRLPAEGDLATSLGVSRMTLRQALASLESKGVIRRSRGRNGGTFIAEPKIECDLTGLAGFTEQMRRAQVRAGARVISASTVCASLTVAQALGLERRTPVHQIVRVRSANREPLALEHSYLPAEVFPDLLQHRLSGSLYSLMTKEYRRAPHTARESLESVIAEGDDARLLRIPEGSPLMRIERTAYTVSGLPVEYASDLFRSDRVRIALHTSIGGPERVPRVVATPFQGGR